MPSQKLNIIVVGAGIGGLAAAIALRRSGHRITVYEKASLSHEIGQGITLPSNAGRILRDLGLDFEKARMIDFLGSNVIRASTLEYIAEKTEPRQFGELFGVPMKTAYRINLHAALVDLACRIEGEGEPVDIITSAGVAAFDGENGLILFDSGKTASADLVVVADGVKSSAAAYINGPNCPPLESSDTMVFRFTLPKEAMLADPLTKRLLDADPGICTFSVGQGGHPFLVQYGCRDDGLQNFALYALRSADEAETQENEIRFKSDREHLLKEMEGFHPAFLRLAEMTTDVLPLWRCTTREPLRTLHRGRLVVMGDAAHPVKPHLGQGAVSAIEDAGVLGALFRDIPSTGDLAHHISERLQLNDKLRIPRVAVYKYYSDVPYFLSAVDEQREKCEKFINLDDLPPNQTELGPWLMRFDAVADAENHLKELLQTNGVY